MKTSEVAELVGISASTLRRWEDYLDKEKLQPPESETPIPAVIGLSDQLSGMTEKVQEMGDRVEGLSEDIKRLEKNLTELKSGKNGPNWGTIVFVIFGLLIGVGLIHE